MVDLSKAKAGDTVKFRCGGTAVIDKVEHHNASADLVFKGETLKCMPYWDDGTVYIREGSRLLDITEVIPAPEVFDWNDARWGMAFRDPRMNLLIFIAEKPSFKGTALFEIQTAGGGYDYVGHHLHNSNLTRAPEHDIKPEEKEI